MSNFPLGKYIFFAPKLNDRFKWMAPASMGYYIIQASPLDVFLPSRDFKNAEKLSFNLEF